MIAYFTLNITFVNAQYNVTVIKKIADFAVDFFLNKLLFLLNQFRVNIWSVY